MLCLAAVPFLLATQAQETRHHQFLRGIPSHVKDQLPVRRLGGSQQPQNLNTTLPVLSKDELHLSSYNMFTRMVSVSWESTTPGLDWELQLQRWNRYGDEVLASWVAVVDSRSALHKNNVNKDTQMREVFVDLHRYLYAFRVRAMGSNGTKGSFSSPTDLYGESLGKNETVLPGTPALQTSEFDGEPVKPEVLKLDSGFPLRHRGDQTYAVLKNVKASFELDVQASFATFFNWAHKVLPILRRSISKHLNNSASVGIQSGELHFNSTRCEHDDVYCKVRKFAVFNVSAIVLPKTSGAEYDTQVKRVVESLLDAKLLQVFVSQLIDQDLSVPHGLALSQSTGASVEEVELSVDVKSQLVDSEVSSVNVDSTNDLYFLVGGGIALLVCSLVICFLVRKYRRLSHIANELDSKKNQHAEVMSDIEKQASEIRHEMEEIQHTRDAIHHEMAMNPAISNQVPELAVEAGNADVLPTLLSAAAAIHSVKETAKK
jgi:hypothetical protein